jgi:hypothetical protein
MATKRIATNGSGDVALELDAAEYETITRALAKALVRAREVGASADEHDLVRLLSALETGAFPSSMEA